MRQSSRSWEFLVALGNNVLNSENQRTPYYYINSHAECAQAALDWCRQFRREIHHLATIAWRIELTGEMGLLHELARDIQIRQFLQGQYGPAGMLNGMLHASIHEQAMLKAFCQFLREVTA
jgi:hypothetical protein